MDLLLQYLWPRPASTDRPVVLVTGCSQGGIGYSVCEEYARKGCTVYATARNPDKMKGLSEQGVVCLTLDVTQKASVVAAVKEVSWASMEWQNAATCISGLVI